MYDFAWSILDHIRLSDGYCLHIGPRPRYPHRWDLSRAGSVPRICFVCRLDSYIAGSQHRIRQISFHICMASSWWASPGLQSFLFSLAGSLRQGLILSCAISHQDVWTGTRIPSRLREGLCVCSWSSRTARAWIGGGAFPLFSQLGHQCRIQASRLPRLSSWAYAGLECLLPPLHLSLCLIWR